MKKRFEVFLKALKGECPKCPSGLASDRIPIGCPHCETAHSKNEGRNYNFNCGKCAYTSVAKEIDDGSKYYQKGDDFACVKVFTFGEIDYETINHLITLDRQYIEIFAAPKDFSEEEIKALQTFAKGHIEWADLVLKKKDKKRTIKEKERGHARNKG
jgi:ribosomal protein S27AE